MSLNSVGIDIVVSVGICDFEYTETHYFFILRLRRDHK